MENKAYGRKATLTLPYQMSGCELAVTFQDGDVGIIVHSPRNT